MIDLDPQGDRAHVSGKLVRKKTSPLQDRWLSFVGRRPEADGARA